ncbi:hypothetical protein GCM10010390_26350 [Streptomyces mordarskii]|uniref:Uncharacterized protein n=1 Tax=Streptomyces mordarskii TaxID=1226758 RepID=A0ABP3MPM6_9ACTN
MEAGDDHGVDDVVVQAAEAEVRECPEAGGAQVGQDVVVAGGRVVVGAAGPGDGYPDQSAAFIGQGEEVQAAMVVFAAVVAPVGLSGAVLGGDEGPVDQDQLPTLLGGLLQGAVQARGLGGERCGISITARPPTCPGAGMAEARSSASCSLTRSRSRFSDSEFIPLRPCLRHLLDQLFLEFVQFRAPRGNPFQQLGIQHAADRRRPLYRGEQEPDSRLLPSRGSAAVMPPGGCRGARRRGC